MTTTGTPPLKPPEHLQGRARAWFEEMVDAYAGFDTEPHSLELLTAAAVQLQRIETARELITKDGITIQDRFGFPKEHPACLTERAASNLFRLLCRELGLQSATDDQTRIPRGR